MEKIIKFLKNPQNQGLHVHNYKIKLSKIAEFIDHVNEKYGIQNFSQRGGDGNQLIKTFIERGTKTIKYRDKQLSQRLNEALILILIKEDKPEIGDYYSISNEKIESQRSTPAINSSIGFWRMQRVLTPFPTTRSGLMDSMLFPEHFDVLYIDFRLSKDEESMLIEFVSLNEIGFKMFNDLILCLPILNDSFEKVSQRKTYCEKYIFKIYDLVVQLWITLEDKFIFNDNIENFLTASIKYYSEEEWITSIILSSISVESILAELYEDEYKRNAPDVALGKLLTHVEKKIKFPADLRKKLQALNKARIASVHRSENPVSDKDTIISMMGITCLLIWYFDKS